MSTHQQASTAASSNQTLALEQLRGEQEFHDRELEKLLIVLADQMTSKQWEEWHEHSDAYVKAKDVVKEIEYRRNVQIVREHGVRGNRDLLASLKGIGKFVQFAPSLGRYRDVDR